MTGLTTHVLDIMHGRPAADVRIDLGAHDGAAYRLVKTLRTNANGRTDQPFLDAAALVSGQYELLFHIGDYFAALGVALPSPRFFDVVPIRFGIAAPTSHYHVPLLVAPWGYQTYRGS